MNMHRKRRRGDGNYNRTRRPILVSSPVFYQYYSFQHIITTLTVCRINIRVPRRKIKASIMRPQSGPWIVQASSLAKNTRNPWDDLKENWQCNPNIEKIDLTADQNAALPEEATRILYETVIEGKCNGYAPSVGYEEARKAVIEYLKLPLQPKDVILSSGCSSCLDICITGLADRSQNILVPKPGNPIYKTISEGLGIDVKEYDLHVGTWEVDLNNLKNKIDSKTAAIIFNNPHNPTGTSYSSDQLWSMLDLSYRYKIPLIVDELHADLMYPDERFNSIIELNLEHNKIPVLVCGGIGKGFMVPGWRLGWILVHDPVNAFEDVRKALISLSQRIIGCNTVVQGALENLLRIPDDFRVEFMDKVSENARLVKEKLDGLFGMTVYIPQATIFLVISIDFQCYPVLKTSKEFCRCLLKEMSVFCVPAEVFGSINFIRLTLGANKEQLEEAINRIQTFCQKYFNESSVHSE